MVFCIVGLYSMGAGNGRDAMMVDTVSGEFVPRGMLVLMSVGGPEPVLALQWEHWLFCSAVCRHRRRRSSF